MTTAVTSYKNFVGGEWVEAVEGETMEVLNPATGEVIAEVPRGSEKDVERAVQAAQKGRMQLLLRLADVLDENAEELTRLESLNVGKPMSIARDEIPFSADNLR